MSLNIGGSMISSLLLAEGNAATQSLNILKISAYLNENTFTSWIEVWDKVIFDTANSFLWIGLVSLGLSIAALAIVYLLFNEGKELIQKQDWAGLVNMTIWPLIIAIMLGNNGLLLSQSVKILRGVSLGGIKMAQEIQIAGTSAQSALNDVLITNAGKQKIEAEINACKGKEQQALVDCLEGARANIEQIVKDTEAANGGAIPSAFKRVADDFISAIADLATNVGEGDLAGVGQELVGIAMRNTFVPILTVVLAAIQWAFVNILEASLFLSAAFAPIAMGLSLLPLQSRPIVAWVFGFFTIVGIQLGYNIIVGIVAIVIAKANAEYFTDVAFGFFLAIFAPTLAYAFAKGGGVAMYQATLGKVDALVKLTSQALGEVTKIAVKAATGIPAP
jgi:hypothetical protein